MEVRNIAAQETHALRLLVLRPGGVLADCQWPIDTAEGAFHLGVDEGTERICVASFQAATHAQVRAERAWQLRGMATHPHHRGKGAGRVLVEHALAHLREQGADVLWCNARMVAVPFYERLGFRIEGPPFEIPGIGGHHVMWRFV
ncbi:MAG: GNAT family N-acetyltransferase [Flavobacteriales bacterium]|nr:GNAT family N-acetyltransferase [Flavobacteriales bacterium]